MAEERAPRGLTAISAINITRYGGALGADEPAGEDRKDCPLFLGKWGYCGDQLVTRYPLGGSPRM